MTLPYLKADKVLDAEYRRDVSYIPPCKCSRYPKARAGTNRCHH